MNEKEASLFVTRFAKGEHTPEEYGRFSEWLETASTDQLGVIADEHETFLEDWSPAGGPSARWIEQLERKLDKAGIQRIPVRKFGRVRQMRNGWWAAAASILVLLSAGAYLLWYHQSGPQSVSQKSPVEVLSQVISTARGQQQELLLPDSSKVWLNASSTLKYPASFTGSERNVELSGEAFFEVAKNAVMPFKVKVRDVQIQVLGTHFNVMGYQDEPVCKTTLVEGIVKISRGTEERVLQPGEQVEVDYPASGTQVPMKLIQGVDPESVMAWKSGTLQFNNADLKTVMRGISRTYDVDIQYDGDVPNTRFSGSFPKGERLDDILTLLGKHNIHAKNKGKIIVVTP